MTGASGTRSLRMTFRMPAGALSALMSRVSTEQSSHAPLAEALPRNGAPATHLRPSLAQVCVWGGRVCLSVCLRVCVLLLLLLQPFGGRACALTCIASQKGVPCVDTCGTGVIRYYYKIYIYM
jgi:hypothetical protein